MRSRIQAIFCSQFLWVHLSCVSRCRKWHWLHLVSTIALPAPSGSFGGANSEFSLLPATRPGDRTQPFAIKGPWLSVSDTSAGAGFSVVRIHSLGFVLRAFP